MISLSFCRSHKSMYSIPVGGKNPVFLSLPPSVIPAKAGIQCLLSFLLSPWKRAGVRERVLCYSHAQKAIRPRR